MAAILQSIKLAIRTVTQGRELMQETGVTMSEKPLQSVDRESTTDLWVFVNIPVVIEIDEIVTECLAEDDPDNRGQKNADRDRDSAIVSRVGLRQHCRHR